MFGIKVRIVGARIIREMLNSVKWNFTAHSQTRLRRTKSRLITCCDIRAGVSKFWWCEGFSPEFSQTCPKSCATFAYKFSPTNIMKIFFWCDLHKNDLHLFSCKRCAPFLWSEATLGAMFAWIFRDFAQIFWSFDQIFRDFAQTINKSKLLGARLHSRPPLYRCAAARSSPSGVFCWAAP